MFSFHLKLITQTSRTIFTSHCFNVLTEETNKNMTTIASNGHTVDVIGYGSINTDIFVIGFARHGPPHRGGAKGC